MSSNPEFEAALAVPFSALQYRDIASFPRNSGAAVGSPERPSENRTRRRIELDMTEAELAERILKERRDAAAEAEQKLRRECEEKIAEARFAVAEALTRFAEERDEYFARVESEIVQLSLSIAARILHREAQVDPMLLASLVRIAVDRMRDHSSVRVRVRPERAVSWRDYFEAQNITRVTVLEDAELTDQDCVLETGFGSTNLGLDSQLKEIEQGFFDLLALRPGR